MATATFIQYWGGAAWTEFTDENVERTPTLTERLAAWQQERKDLLTGQPTAPWLTHDEAIEQAEQRIADLRERLGVVR